MAVAATRPAVTTTATLIAQNTDSAGTSDPMTLSFWLQNVTATAIVYLGGDNTVTSSTGAQWDGSKKDVTVSLEPGESLYGIVAAAGPTQTIHALSQGRLA